RCPLRGPGGRAHSRRADPVLRLASDTAYRRHVAASANRVVSFRRWWEFNDDGRWLAVSLGFGVINLLYVVLSAAGLMRSHAIFGIGLFVLFLLLRSAFLGTLENPEPRYTLECYPAVIVLASVFASALLHRRA